MKSKIVKEFRKRQGWTQQQLADFFSASLSTASKWERGLRTPPDSLIAWLALLDQYPPPLDVVTLDGYRCFLSSLLTSQTR